MPRIFDASTSAVINAIAQDMTQRIPTATAANLATVSQIILDSKDLTNQFLNALVNRIAAVEIRSRLYANPLAPFRQGTNRYGDLIEDVFVEMANAHEFDPRVAEDELFKREIPNVSTVFHKMNSQLFYKQTISNEQLAKAFQTEDGMRQLIAKIVDAMYSGANYDEFLSMKNVFSAARTGFAYIKTATPSASTSDAIVMNIKAASNLLLFASDLYNAVGVKNFTPRENQVLFLRADVEAIIDVATLARAFNMDKAEFMGRTVLVDDFGANMDNVYAILADDSLLITRINLDKFTEQYNAQGLSWNYFYHIWRTYAASPYSNAIAFTTADLVAATGVTVSAPTGSGAVGTDVLMTATVAPSTTTAQAVRWELVPASGTQLDSGTYITSTGYLRIGAHQTTDFAVKATVISTPTVYDTLSWSNGAWVSENAGGGGDDSSGGGDDSSGGGDDSSGGGGT